MGRTLRVSVFLMLLAAMGCLGVVDTPDSEEEPFRDPVLLAQIGTLSPAGIGAAHNTAVRAMLGHIHPVYLREPTDAGKFGIMRSMMISYSSANFTPMTRADIVRSVDESLELVIRRIGTKGRFWDFRDKTRDGHGFMNLVGQPSQQAESFVSDILQVADDTGLDTGTKQQMFASTAAAAASVLTDEVDLTYVASTASVASESLSMWDASLQGALAGNGDPLWASIFLVDPGPVEGGFRAGYNFTCGIICKGLIKLAKVVGTDVMGGIGGFLTGGGTPEAALLGAALASTALMLSEA